MIEYKRIFITYTEAYVDGRLAYFEFYFIGSRCVYVCRYVICIFRCATCVGRLYTFDSKERHSNQCDWFYKCMSLFRCFSITIKSDDLNLDSRHDFFFLLFHYVTPKSGWEYDGRFVFLPMCCKVLYIVYVRRVWLCVYRHELIVCYIQSANVLFHSYSYYRNSLLILYVFINYLRDLNLRATKPLL